VWPSGDGTASHVKEDFLEEVAHEHAPKRFADTSKWLKLVEAKIDILVSAVGTPRGLAA
jgi:hypothetical protein